MLWGAAAAALWRPARAADADPEAETINDHLWKLYAGGPAARAAAHAWLRARGKPDVVAGLIDVMRLNFNHHDEIDRTLQAVTGAVAAGEPDREWFNWMRWQEAHPEIRPYQGYATFKAGLFGEFDFAFADFLMAPPPHRIRIEEVTWGGVRKDGIPALVNPAMVAAAEARYLTDDEPVFGVEIEGDARAYPFRIMDWHEMANDVVGGVPVALAYCTLCGAGILFDTRVEGRAEPFVFGSSGLLYRSNKLMYDRQTDTLWNQFSGRPVIGPLAAGEIKLKVLPVAIASWREWRARHPMTRVLSLETGHVRDYTPGRPYGGYFASPDLMFPIETKDGRLKPKDQVFGLRLDGREKAWPLAAFGAGKVINDRIGDTPLVLIGSARERTVRAYRGNGRPFAKGASAALLTQDGASWRMEETALVGPDGARLDRLPGHVAYWFAWSGYLPEADFYRE
ncbi:DUF3179 domain-containing protein [Desertibaculum subflavum]|uniref:DUF3179 domain-containing protein n=1 Tax=Desertibaculum subflavum TaxID=2268458 RepID=UPI0013C4EB64